MEMVRVAEFILVHWLGVFPSGKPEAIISARGLGHISISPVDFH